MEKRLGLIGVGLEGNRWPRASCGAFLPSSEAKVATAARSECKTALRRSGHLEQRRAIARALGLASTDTCPFRWGVVPHRVPGSFPKANGNQPLAKPCSDASAVAGEGHGAHPT
eukprot:CAMPEP_0115321256 /NCGR_PEP_ID=MMETSP0270-20121206/80763_1 /TAXON_ID=71861 /ORGANISM="Scrippsiella trochoidea, Strain CCMP3099" /LENGTH=113 /DNA_ID=CAMNT_0002741125 /DNA_START=1190 /DNA_END=1527 /DNA_ORIENTATION=+